MTSTLAREHELMELRDDLDAAASIVGDACGCGADELPRDDLVWAISTINKAADFVQRSLEQHIRQRTKP